MKAVILAGGYGTPISEETHLKPKPTLETGGRALAVSGNLVTSFEEKPHGDGGWINGGFFVVAPEVLAHIEGDATIWERGPMEALARHGKLAAYTHRGFWHAMDTLRDKNQLDEMWSTGKAPWKIWS